MEIQYEEWEGNIVLPIEILVIIQILFSYNGEFKNDKKHGQGKIM